MTEIDQPNEGDLIIVNGYHIFEVREWKVNETDGYVYAKVRKLPNTTTPEPRTMHTSFSTTSWEYLAWEDGGTRKEITRRSKTA